MDEKPRKCRKCGNPCYGRYCKKCHALHRTPLSRRLWYRQRKKKTK